MENAKKFRKPVRAKVTRLCNEIEAELATRVPFKENLTDLLAQLEATQIKLLLEDTCVKTAMLEQPITDLQAEKEFDECEEYCEKVRLIKERVVHAVTPKYEPSELRSENLRASKDQLGEKKSYKLPKIELPKFNGELKNWLGWWSQFQKIDQDKDLHNSDKFQYLLQATEEKSEPREMIKVYPPTGDNYEAAVETLKRRYGREGLQLQVYLRELLQLVIVNVTKKDKIPLEKLYIKLESHIRALNTLDLSKAEPSLYFYPLVESCLPEEVLRTWLRHPATENENADDKKNKLDYLMDFLKKEVEGEQQIYLAQNTFQDKPKNNGRTGSKTSNKNSEGSTAMSLFAGSSGTCIFCDKNNHGSTECFKARKMNIDEKRKKVRESKGCETCLKRGHGSKNCRSRISCFLCEGQHHTMMCPQLVKKESDKPVTTENVEQVQANTVQPTTAPSTSASNSGSDRYSRKVLMKTLHVRVQGTNGKEKQVRLLFDEGSQCSYIKTTLADELNCKKTGEVTMQNCLFGGGLTGIKKRNKHLALLQGSDGKYLQQKKDVVLINEHTIVSSCPIIPNGPWISELAKRNIHITDTCADLTEVEILIGSDLWGSLMTGKMVKLKRGLIAVESIFGWTVSGEIKSQYEESCASLVTTLTMTSEKSLTDLWSLEAIGIKDSSDRITQEEQDLELKRTFQESISQNQEGRYVVSLPWICDSKILADNKAVALKRLENATKKLKDQNQYEKYNKIFGDWVSEGIIEKMQESSTNEHYLPHRPVFKPESLTTPVRPVFDASCKTGKGPSLNDCLAKGPNLLELIPSILCRFREKKIGVSSDIRKAFQMIEVQQEDRNYQKFLWWEDPEKKTICEYRHCRVVFGMNCSPFMLAAVLDYHLKHVKEEDKSAAELLLKSLYVDNSLVSFDTVHQYQDFRETSVRLLAEAKMELRQWETNQINESTEDENPYTSVLGMKWDKEKDLLSCQLPKKLKDLEEMKITKRNVLSLVSQIYDPIGVTCPAIIQPKLQIQGSWALKVGWDQEWEKSESKRFYKWSSQIEDLAKIEIPRHAFGNSSKQALQFHCFTDASQNAYAAVVFVRVTEGETVKVQLLMAKSRLAPISKKNARVTIPRLELLGCLIGSILTHNVLKYLNKENYPTFYWSDSSTALAWIKRDADWGSFVGNRVREIRKLSKGEAWRHVPGVMNPADLPSRGCSPSQLLESRWWEGPEWLKQTEEFWPSSEDTLDEEEVSLELKKTPVPAIVSQEFIEPRFSSYLKNVRVAAWIRRFLDNCHKDPLNRIYSKWPTNTEMKKGENDILLQIQKRHFNKEHKFSSVRVQLQEDGLLHVQTRLTYKDDWDQFKSPILLPNKDPLVVQLIMNVHILYCHAGTQFLLNKIREKFWIIQGRKTVSRIIKMCVTCRRFSIKNFSCDPSPLPQHRIETQAAFQTTGVDLAGPLILKGGKKAWIVLYTCAVYRGVYLDWVESLSTDDFIDSLEKFTLTVGRPSIVCSDNGTNFVGAQNLMKKLDWKKLEENMHVKSIKWIFNPPTAAWWGGWWERLVRTIKDILRKILGTAKLTHKGLTSCLASVSYVINNRPLTTLNEDMEDLIPLTPSMFMKDLPVGGLPEREMITSKHLQESYKKIQDIKRGLVERFRKEYLGLIMQKSREKSSPAPEINQVVLVGADNKKRCEWPLGRILKLYPGKDGKIRVAKVRTASGILTRPLQRLYPLEVPLSESMPITPVIKSDENIEDIDQQQIQDSDDDEEFARTRSGRIVKKPHRYGAWNK